MYHNNIVMTGVSTRGSITLRQHESTQTLQKKPASRVFFVAWNVSDHCFWTIQVTCNSRQRKPGHQPL